MSNSFFFKTMVEAGWVSELNLPGFHKSTQIHDLLEGKLEREIVEEALPAIQALLGRGMTAMDTQRTVYLEHSTSKKRYAPDVSIVPPASASEKRPTGSSVVTVFEFKRVVRRTINTDLGQLLNYLLAILHNQPARKSVVGFLTNGVTFIAMRVFQPGSTTKIEVSEVMDFVQSEEGIRKCLNEDGWGHEYDPNFHCPLEEGQLVLDHRLGQGQSGAVFKASLSSGLATDPQDLFLKVFRGQRECEGLHAQIQVECSAAELDNERKILRELQAVGANVPKVLNYSKDSLLLTPVAEVFGHEHAMLRRAHVRSIVSTLKDAHDLGYLHRDISKNNIMCLSETDALVVDWASATPKDELAPCGGTTSYCSDRALGLLAEQAERLKSEPWNPFSVHDHEWTAADDLESLVRVVFVLVHDHPFFQHELREASGVEFGVKAGAHESEVDYQKLKRFWEAQFAGTCWERVRDTIPSHEALWNTGAKCDYARFTEALCALVPV
jgi:tRNA A-37 threonylcarbamoyl transferase component Bud32